MAGPRNFAPPCTRLPSGKPPPTSVVWPSQEEDVSQQALVAENCEITELSDEERDRHFARPLSLRCTMKLGRLFGNTMFDLLEG